MSRSTRFLALLLVAACGSDRDVVMRTPVVSVVPAVPVVPVAPVVPAVAVLPAPVAIEERYDPASSIVSVAIGMPDDVSGWRRVDLRRARGAVPPAASCEDGVIVASTSRFDVEGALLLEPALDSEPMQDDSYRVCIYGDDARAPGATIALKGHRHLPWVGGEGTGCGIDVKIAGSPLPDDAVTLALVLAPYAGQFGELVPLACEEQWVAREIDRSVLDAIGRVGDRKDPDVASVDVGLWVHLGEEVVGCDREHALRVCMRDRDGVLHGDGEAERLASRVQTTPSDWTGPTVRTPSGSLAWYELEPGTVLLGYDLTQRAAIEVRINRSITRRDRREVTLRLEGGRDVRLPADRPVWLDALATWRAAEELVAGDVVWTDRLAPARVVSRSIERGSDAADLDVLGGETYFEHGVLVREARPTAESAAPTLANMDEEDVVLRAADQSFDCMLDARLDVRAWPAGASSIALMVTSQVGARGARSEVACTSEHVIAEVPGEVFEKMRADAAFQGERSLSLAIGISGEPVGCSTDHALLACTRDAGGALAPMPGARARHGLSGASCFAAGTPIATPHGLVAIEALSPGMALLAYDVERGSSQLAQVVRVVDRPGRPIFSITLASGVVLRLTAEHPLWDPAHAAFRRAGEFVVGDTLMLRDGSSAAVTAIEDHGERATVYDLSVSGPHTYFAGGVLVHNY